MTLLQRNTQNPKLGYDIILHDSNKIFTKINLTRFHFAVFRLILSKIQTNTQTIAANKEVKSVHGVKTVETEKLLRSSNVSYNIKQFQTMTRLSISSPLP